MRKLGLVAAVAAALGGGVTAPVATAAVCAPAVVDIADAPFAYEGSSGGYTAFQFAVTATVEAGCPGPAGSLTWATAFGSAGPGDIVAAEGVLQWTGSAATQHITVQVAADSLEEGAETFGVGLWHPRGVTLGRAQATTTIIDDERPPLVVNLDGGKICWREPVAIQAETTVCPVPVRLSVPARAPVTVRYRTVRVGSDPLGYVPVKDGTLTIQPGQSVGYIPITILRDGRTTEERLVVEVFWTSAGKIGNGRTEVRILPGSPS